MAVSTELQRQFLAEVSAGNIDKVRMMVERDPSLVKVRDVFGQTVIEIAASRVYDESPGHREIVIALCDAGATCDLFVAARAGLLDRVVQLIVLSPGLVKATDAEGRTALQRAVLLNGACGYCDQVAETLLAEGAPVDIFTACVFGWTSVVRGEIAVRPEVVGKAVQGGTPLLWALRARRNLSETRAIAADLIHAGSIVDARDEQCDDNTALHMAAWWADQADVAALLLRAGADPTLANGSGRTPLDIAIERQHLKVADVLMEALGLGPDSEVAAQAA